MKFIIMQLKIGLEGSRDLILVRMSLPHSTTLFSVLLTCGDSLTCSRSLSYKSKLTHSESILLMLLYSQFHYEWGAKGRITTRYFISLFLPVCLVCPFYCQNKAKKNTTENSHCLNSVENFSPTNPDSSSTNSTSMPAMHRGLLFMVTVLTTHL